MEFCIECQVNPLDGYKKKFCSKKCKQKHYDRKAREQKKKEEKTFPVFTCQHCGHKNQLDFDPRYARNSHKWNYFKCEKCAKVRTNY